MLDGDELSVISDISMFGLLENGSLSVWEISVSENSKSFEVSEESSQLVLHAVSVNVNANTVDNTAVLFIKFSFPCNKKSVLYSFTLYDFVICSGKAPPVTETGSTRSKHLYAAL